MTDLLMIFLAAMLAVPAAVIFLSERNYRRLPYLPNLNNIPLSSVEIIVPARNESASIERLVCSLVALDYPSVHLTVVDDGSSDDTALKAKVAGAAVLCLSSDLPPGWTGKCNACDQAARYSEADWLLFTDADTYHTPDSLRRVVTYAERCQLDAVSLLLRQECVTFWERLILPMAYQNYFATLNADQPAFNGQYILIRRAVYEESGGFGAVRGRVMEDVALATLLAAQGYRIKLLNGHSAASVRMYRDLPALLRGMTKTAFVAARDRGGFGLLLGGAVLLGVCAIPALIVGLVTGYAPLLLWGLAMMIITAVGLPSWMRRFEVERWWFYPLLSQIGVFILFGVGFTSTFRTILGWGVRWKGRTIIEHRTA
ncbi:MAG: glycosyltransferase [Chloroflexota bacterium]